MDCSLRGACVVTEKIDVTTNIVGDTFFIRLVSGRPPGQHAPLVSISRKRKWRNNVHFFFRNLVFFTVSRQIVKIKIMISFGCALICPKSHFWFLPF